MPRPRVCIVRFSRRLPHHFKTAVVKAALDEGLTVTEVSPDRRMDRAIASQLKCIDRGQCGVFLDIKYKYGKGNVGTVGGLRDAHLSVRLSQRIANQMTGALVNTRETISVEGKLGEKWRPREMRDLHEVSRKSKGKIVPVLIEPCYGDRSDQVQNNLNQPKPAAYVARIITKAAASFIQSHS